MPLTLGLIELDAVLSTLAKQAPLLLLLGRECAARVHLVRLPGRLVLSAGGEHLTAGEMSLAVAALLDVSPPLLPVYGRDARGREFALSVLVREGPDDVALQAADDRPVPEAELRALADA